MTTFTEAAAGDCRETRHRCVAPARLASIARTFGVAALSIGLAGPGMAPAEQASVARFEGSVVMEPIGDDPFVPSFKLTRRLVFSQSDGTQWISPPDALVDGRSMPTLFVQLFGHPFDSTFRKSAVSYDHAVKTKQYSWEAAQRMFHEALLTEGVAPDDAKVMYLLLSGSGTRWAMRGPNSCFSRCHTDAKELEWRPRVDNEKLVSLTSWVRTEDPSLDQIDQRARATIVEKGPHIFGVTPR